MCNRRRMAGRMKKIIGYKRKRITERKKIEKKKKTKIKCKGAKKSCCSNHILDEDCPNLPRDLD